VDNLLGLALICAVAQFFPTRPRAAVLLMASTPMSMGPVLLLCAFLEAAILARGWNTPGKLLFGLRLRTQLLRRPGYWQAWDRSVSVLLRGQGGWLPLASIYGPAQSWVDLTEHGSTHWDRGRYVVEAERLTALGIVLRGALLAILLLVCAAIVGFARL
jgi:uncharacterized RDD family membrane protein YckC